MGSSAILVEWSCEMKGRLGNEKNALKKLGEANSTNPLRDQFRFRRPNMEGAEKEAITFNKSIWFDQLIASIQSDEILPTVNH
ncbi:hypothetical protein WUBG_04378, partial [Wuchereria bancrofti]